MNDGVVYSEIMACKDNIFLCVYVGSPPVLPRCVGRQSIAFFLEWIEKKRKRKEKTLKVSLKYIVPDRYKATQIQ